MIYYTNRNEPNRWCVDGQYKFNRDGKLLNEKLVMTQLVIVDRRVLTRSLHIFADVHSLFTCHRLEWMARSLGSYREEVVREFYASYVMTLTGSLDTRAKPTN